MKIHIQENVFVEIYERKCDLLRIVEALVKEQVYYKVRKRFLTISH